MTRQQLQAIRNFVISKNSAANTPLGKLVQP